MSPIARNIASGTAISLAMASAVPAQTGEDYNSYPGPSFLNMVSLVPLVLVGAIVIGSAGASSAASSEDNSLSMATVTAGILRFGVNYGRLVSDIKYGALETDSARGAVVLRDLEVKGIGEYERCQVTLGKLEMSGLTFWGGEDMRSRFEASDLAIANNCFGPNAAMIGMVTGGDTIPLERLVVDAHQIIGQGAVRLDIEASSPGIAMISGSADFDYFSIVAPGLLKEMMEQSDPYDYQDYQEPSFDENGNLVEPGMGDSPDPQGGVRATLRGAHLTVENLGLWERLQPMVPPEMTSPDSIRQIVTAEPGTHERAMQEALADTLEKFVAEPGMVTVELRPETPVAFDSTGWDGPEDALNVLTPVFSNALPTPPLALIAAPDGDDPLALGLAMAEGRGLPQNSRRAIELLSPLDDNPEAMLAVAKLSAETDPASAYTHAQKAAELGDRNAPAALDGIEQRLATADLLAAQPAADTAVPEEAFASAPALRSIAVAYAEGKGVPRSYVLARRLAGSAAAAGDGQAQALISRLDTRFGDDADWIVARDAAADLALDDWTGKGLAARFAGQ